MAAPSVDTSEYPIVRIRFQPELTHEDIGRHHETFDRLFNERGPFLTIATLDQLRPGHLSAKHRRALGESADALARRGAFIAEFVVTQSSILRGFVTAYSWLRSHKNHPLICFATEAEALAAAHDYLARYNRGQTPRRDARSSDDPPAR